MRDVARGRDLLGPRVGLQVSSAGLRAGGFRLKSLSWWWSDRRRRRPVARRRPAGAGGAAHPRTRGRTPTSRAAAADDARDPTGAHGDRIAIPGGGTRMAVPARWLPWQLTAVSDLL